MTAQRTAPADPREHLRLVLWDDLVTEYDARLYSGYLHGLGLNLTDAFRRVEDAWRIDEERHHRGFAAAYEELFGPERLRSLAHREANFSAIGHLFTDEFSICVLNCFDELATLRGYRANLDVYDPLGPDFRRFVEQVIADEARHYANFLWVIRTRHAHRVDETAAVLDRVVEATWNDYAATFVLDHDDPVYDDSIMQEARDVLLRQVRRPNPTGFEPALGA